LDFLVVRKYMRILEINKFNYLRRGAEKHFLELQELLSGRGHEVAVFAMEHSQNNFSPWQKYFVSYVGYGDNDSLWSKIKGALTRFYSFEAKRKIRKLLKDFRPNIVHIHNIYHQISPSILGEIKKQKIPIVMTVHDSKLVYPHYAPNREGNSIKDYRFWDFVGKKKFKNSWLKSFLVALEFEINRFFNLYDKYIDLYLTPSEFTKKKLIEGGINPKKISVLPHFSFSQEEGIKKDLNNKEKYVLHYGSLSKEKGTDKLIEIFRKLPEIKLYLAGNIEPDLQIPELPNVEYLGFCQPKELERLIKNSLIVVSASTLWETFGLVALEAIQNGKPFVGFSGLSFSEIIENNRNGFLVENKKEMAEKIKLLAQDEGLRILFGRNALERAKMFNSEDYAEKLENHFKKLISIDKN